MRQPSRCRVVCSATRQDAPIDVSRRQLLTATGMGLIFSTVGMPALADEEVKKVFVAGATGQTGRRVVEQLRARGIAVRAGVRDIKKAESLGLAFAREGSPPVELVKFDVTGSVADLAAAIETHNERPISYHEFQAVHVIDLQCAQPVLSPNKPSLSEVLAEVTKWVLYCRSGDADAVICATGFTPTAGNWGGLKP
eukprot:7146744-Pyramimonas_sp.AAC.1